MDDRLTDAMGDEFQIRLKQRLAEAGLTGDADVQRTLGPQIVNEIACEIKDEVMHLVLRAARNRAVRDRSDLSCGLLS
ncbi:hypothetical protein XI03_10120 [Bradyrhizobium sp. CCBAU 65884]|nr:hypothetical protein [Bradyrhizobium sp. CCBAU 65884]